MEAGSAAGFHRPYAAFPCRPRARGTGLAARDQARRLQAHRPQGRPARPAVVAHGRDWRSVFTGIALAVAALPATSLMHRRRGGCPPPGRNVRLPRLGVIESPRRLSDRLRPPPARRAGHADVALEARRDLLAALLREHTSASLFFSEAVEGETGAALFRHACNMGLEGIISKRKGSPYRWKRRLGCTLPESISRNGLSVGAGGPREHPDEEIICAGPDTRGASGLD